MEITKDITNSESLEQKLARLIKENEALTNALGDANKKALILEKDNEALAQENRELSASITENLNQTKLLEDKYKKLEKENKQSKKLQLRLIEMLMLANLRTFSPRSEKTHVIPGQLSLFNDMEFASSLGEEDVLEDTPVEQPKTKKSRKKKRKMDWSKFETEVIEHVLNEEDLVCGACGDEIKDMGYDIKRVVRFVPATFIVEEHHVHKYVCKSCSCANATDGETPAYIVKASAPVTPLPKSAASASLIAYVLQQKYEMALPLYRITGELNRNTDFGVTRQTLGNWVINTYKRWLSLIYQRLRYHLFKHEILAIDETTTLVLKEPNRKPSGKSYMWVVRTCAEGVQQAPIVMFTYDPSRSRRTLMNILGNWSGYAVTDGYGAYDDMGPSITHVSCLVHCRRSFTEIVKALDKNWNVAQEKATKCDSVALRAHMKITNIFHTENTIVARGESVEERTALRKRYIAPLLDEFESWAKVEITKCAPGMELYKAFANALKQWPYVRNGLLDSRIPWSSNIVEQSIRPFKIGARNWLFSDTPMGAEASAAMYSIVSTAKLNGLKAYNYLDWLLTELPKFGEPSNVSDADLDKLMPWSANVPATCLASKNAIVLDERPSDPLSHFPKEFKDELTKLSKQLSAE
jgi:transposase